MRAPALDRRQRASLGTGGGVPSRPQEERPVAECASAGRRIALPGTYIVRGGDSLWKIAERHYGDGGRYRAIVRANRSKLPDPDEITPCQRLILPRR